MRFMLMMHAPARHRRLPGQQLVARRPQGAHRLHARAQQGARARPASASRAEGLAPPGQAKLVRAGKNGAPVTDGPFPESKEFLAGYWIVDVDTPERAYEIAAKASCGAGTRRRAAEHADRSPPGDERDRPTTCDIARRSTPTIEHLLRELAPQVLGAVAVATAISRRPRMPCRKRSSPRRRSGRREGMPDNPRGWLYQVAARRLTDHVRSEMARRRREDVVAIGAVGRSRRSCRRMSARSAPSEDDTLVLLFMCCHPALTPPSAIALTLRAVGGLTTAEIANAFLVPEATMAQRISRAKQTHQGVEHRRSGMPTDASAPSG